jgi:integrase/recombinase XerD
MRDLNQFVRYIGTKNAGALKDISKNDIERYIDHMTKNGKSTATVSRAVASLKCFFSYQIFKGPLKFNPLNDIETVRTIKKLPQF